MKYLSWFAGLISLTLLPATAAGAEDKLHVVTTTSDLRSLVEAVGGDYVEVKSLGTGREDPHFIDAKPSCMILAKNADLWVRIGLELEIGYEQLVLDGSHNPLIRVGTPGHLDASEGVLKLEVPTGKIDRSLGDIHPLGNPHYWLDPLNGRVMAKNIAARLSQLDTAHADYYSQRLKEFLHRLDEAMFGPQILAAADEAFPNDDEVGAKLWVLLLKNQLDTFVQEHGGAAIVGGWWGAMKTLHGTRILTYHRSWSYFVNRFGLEVVMELEPKPGIEPGPQHLSEVVKQINGQQIKFLLMEPFYNRKSADWVADKTGLKIVEVANSVGGQPEATDYISMLDHIVQSCLQAVSDMTATTQS
ncbi:MAG: hypothetical protein HJJLKODD_01448 [Phycisphaerae bacterium]|nr:hypothetical protein [Phycisphaerae bacterium]